VGGIFRRYFRGGAEVEAVLLRCRDRMRVAAWLGDACAGVWKGGLTVRTRTGEEAAAGYGRWIVRNADGAFHVLGCREFEETCRPAKGEKA
jgi:hypothetical protein